MGSGTVTIANDGAMVLTGSAVDAAQGHALWCVLRMWGYGFTDERIQGLTKKQALSQAGRMTGADYKPSDLKRATIELEIWWKRTLAGATLIREDEP
jgi:hypothetical protein